MIQSRCIYYFRDIPYYGSHSGYIYTFQRNGDYIEYTYINDSLTHTCNVNSVFASALILIESAVDLPTPDSHPEYFI
mgnify:CR=1 FL=1